MVTMPVIQLKRRLGAVTIAAGASPQTRSDGGASAAAQSTELAVQMQEMETQKQLYRDACAALQQAAARLERLYDDIFAGHSEAIARLSVEIARKVLLRNISDGDYQIELIIKEALASIPESAGSVVRLNPHDLSALQALQAAGDETLSGVKLTADPSIGRAECVVESPKGMMKLLIDEHLEQISKALTKTG